MEQLLLIGPRRPKIKQLTPCASGHQRVNLVCFYSKKFQNSENPSLSAFEHIFGSLLALGDHVHWIMADLRDMHFRPSAMRENWT